MRLSSLCVLALATAFAVGLAPGLLAQAELAEPGLQIVGKGGEAAYDLATTIHTLVFAGLAPLFGIALALAVVGEARSSRIAQAGSIVALAGAPLLAIALAAGVFRKSPPLPGPWQLSAALPDGLMLLQAAAGLLALILVAVLATGRRAAAVIFAVLSGIAIALSALEHVVLANDGSDHFLHDTYYVLAANHEAGVAIALNLLGVLTVWSIRWDGLKRTWFSVLAGVAALGAGTLAVLAAGRLGIMGMPRRYGDYPPAFATEQSVLALWSMAFAAVLVAAVVWLAIAAWREKHPPGVETVSG